MDLKDIKRVIQMVEDANISHLSLELNGTKIEVKKEWASAPSVHYAAPAVQMAIPATPVAPTESHTQAPKEAHSDDHAHLISIKSQMVGTFYASSKPDSPAFIKPGDTIVPGQVLCIVEAMKLFNEIESEISGIVEKVCVENGMPVEYGQELFKVRPN